MINWRRLMVAPTLKVTTSYRPTPTTGRGSDVRFGSEADICSAIRHVRFTPESELARDNLARTDKIALAAIAKLERGVK